MSLLLMENITKEFKMRTVLNGVTLKVEKGERLALIGPNGSGKSTLLKIAVGLESCDSGNVSIARNIKVGYLSQSVNDIINDDNGETAIYCKNVMGMEKKMRQLEMKMSNLSPADKNEQKTLLDEYAKLTSRFEAIDGYNAETEIKKILFGMDIREEALTIPICKLSGGEKMRVAIARMLLTKPDLIILDEPTNHLDIGACEWLEGFLCKFSGGVIVVSHDRYFLDHVATRVAELVNGCITERAGNYTNFMEQKGIMKDYLLKEQKRLEIQIKRDNEVVQRLKSMGRISAWKSREHITQKRNEERLKDLKEMKQRNHLYKKNPPKIAFKKVDHTSKDIAEVRGLFKSFKDVDLFKNAEFCIRGGERVGIIGPNGCGKTTLINILLGNDKDYKGYVRLGEWVKYSYMGQEISFKDENRTVVDEIMAQKEMLQSEALDYLSRFQFYGDDTKKSIGVLSGGERVRLYLACIMLGEPTCLILDEPTNHLDIAAREALESALLEFKGTVIAVTHDRYFLNSCVNRMLEISGCRINSYEGNYEHYRQMKDKAYNSDDRTIHKQGKWKKENVSEKIKSDGTKIDGDNIEWEIMRLEKMAKDMERSFDSGTDPEKYREYNDLLNRIDKLYAAWDSTI